MRPMPDGEPDGGDETDGGARPSDEADRRRVTEAFSALAPEPGKLPTALCRACADLLPVTGASVSIVSGRTVSTVWCASDRTAARLAEAQYTLGDGPCTRALDLVALVLAADLTRGPDARRWPVFAQQAVALGVRAVFSLPLGISGQAIGTLDLYRDTAGELSDPDLRLALLARDAVTFAVLGLQSAHDGGDRAPGGGLGSWVEAAEADHMEVHHAIGMIMVQLGVDPEQALDRMRAHAFVQGRTVTEVAQDVLARTVRFQPEVT